MCLTIFDFWGFFNLSLSSHPHFQWMRILPCRADKGLLLLNSIPSFSQERAGIIWIHFVSGEYISKLSAFTVALPMAQFHGSPTHTQVSKFQGFKALCMVCDQLYFFGCTEGRGKENWNIATGNWGSKFTALMQTFLLNVSKVCPNSEISPA